ncbi:hypothetical protein GQ55_3G404300 [Panicum hallii var. hallii]|uniref:Uncharacterized protein n=1 Tax=Panicum hallii var. hallii TaxID=1504633 RepID=A0A2T7EGY8_9POAL|nr:hypothetical protein GQ55_3G404300 [Panicum hallii var. hallii]
MQERCSASSNHRVAPSRAQASLPLPCPVAAAASAPTRPPPLRHRWMAVRSTATARPPQRPSLLPMPRHPPQRQPPTSIVHVAGRLAELCDPITRTRVTIDRRSRKELVFFPASPNSSSQRDSRGLGR